MFDRFNFDGDNSSFDRKEFAEFWNKMRGDMMGGPGGHGGPGGPGGPRMPEDPNQIFDMFDRDKNGRLDTNEFEQGARQAGADRDVPMEMLMKQY